MAHITQHRDKISSDKEAVLSLKKLLRAVHCKCRVCVSAGLFETDLTSSEVPSPLQDEVLLTSIAAKPNDQIVQTEIDAMKMVNLFTIGTDTDNLDNQPQVQETFERFCPGCIAMVDLLQNGNKIYLKDEETCTHGCVDQSNSAPVFPCLYRGKEQATVTNKARCRQASCSPLSPRRVNFEANCSSDMCLECSNRLGIGRNCCQIENQPCKSRKLSSDLQSFVEACGVRLGPNWNIYELHNHDVHSTKRNQHSQL